jgi:hypothetical protein
MEALKTYENEWALSKVTFEGYLPKLMKDICRRAEG